MGVQELRSKNRKIVVHEDGTAFQIRRLRQTDFVSKNMILIAASAPKEMKEQDMLKQYLDQYPEDAVMGTLEIEVIKHGVVGVATKKADSDQYDVEPLTVVDTPTEANGQIYYRDLGNYFQWLADQIREYSGLTKEVAEKQDNFSGEARNSSVPA